MFWRIFRLCIWLVICGLIIKFMVPSTDRWVGVFGVVVCTPIYIVADNKIYEEK